MAKVGRSLPNLVRLPSHDFRDITKFLCLSDGDDEAPRMLLTGGLLVRIQPEEPIFATTCERLTFRRITLPFLEPISCGFFFSA